MSNFVSMARLCALALAVALTGGLLLGVAAQSPDSGDGVAAPSAIPFQIAALRLNEFMASHSNFFEDSDEAGEYPDWIEIYNPGVEPVDVKGIALSDDLANPTRSPITSSLIVPARFGLTMLRELASPA